MLFSTLVYKKNQLLKQVIIPQNRAVLVKSKEQQK